MPKQPISFDVEAFELVPAGDERVLVRVSGRWRGPARSLGDIALVLSAGGKRRRVRALPDPSAEDPTAGPDGVVWRGAFSLPLARVEGASFSLASEAGAVELPRPSRRPSPAPPKPDAGERRRDDEARRRAKREARETRGALEEERRRSAALEERIAAIEEKERNARSALAKSRDDLSEARALARRASDGESESVSAAQRARAEAEGQAEALRAGAKTEAEGRRQEADRLRKAINSAGAEHVEIKR
nr:hypothetical protein [Thermoleophilaceae bacterium]